MGEIVGRERHSDAIAEDDANAELAHTAAKLRAHLGSGVGFDLKLTTGEDVRHDAFELDVVITLLFREIEIPLLLFLSPPSSPGSLPLAQTVLQSGEGTSLVASKPRPSLNLRPPP